MRVTSTSFFKGLPLAALFPYIVVDRGLPTVFTKEYDIVAIALVLCFVISVALFFITYYLAPKELEPEKLSPYECGFDPFSDARQSFDVKFYLVSILFIIFDLEVMFLFPWALTLGNLGLFGLLSMFFFLAILTVGFFYEWYKGALDWD